MKRLLITTAAAMLMCQSPAHAKIVNWDKMIYGLASDISPEKIEVTGDHTGYTTVTASDVTYTVHFRYDAENMGRVRSWRLDPLAQIDGTWMNPFFLTTYGVSKSYPKGDRPKEVDVLVELTIPMEFLENRILAACNEHLQERLDGGMAPAQAYAKQWMLSTDFYLEPTVDASGPGGNTPDIIEESGHGLMRPVIVCRPIPILHDGPNNVAVQRPSGSAGGASGGVKVGGQPGAGTMSGDTGAGRPATGRPGAAGTPPVPRKG
ncbi:MAG: hypothetical protein AAGK00_15205 [Pseudomonadota bacterium]